MILYTNYYRILTMNVIIAKYLTIYKKNKSEHGIDYLVNLIYNQIYSPNKHDRRLFKKNVKLANVDIIVNKPGLENSNMLTCYCIIETIILVIFGIYVRLIKFIKYYNFSKFIICINGTKSIKNHLEYLKRLSKIISKEYEEIMYLKKFSAVNEFVEALESDVYEILYNCITTFDKYRLLEEEKKKNIDNKYKEYLTALDATRDLIEQKFVINI